MFGNRTQPEESATICVRLKKMSFTGHSRDCLLFIRNSWRILEISMQDYLLVAAPK